MYKRQAIGSNAVLGLQEASIDVCSHDICVRLYLNNNGLDEFIGVYHLDKSSRLLTVSYTHLDVYKRQR